MVFPFVFASFLLRYSSFFVDVEEIFLLTIFTFGYIYYMVLNDLYPQSFLFSVVKHIYFEANFLLLAIFSLSYRIDFL